MAWAAFFMALVTLVEIPTSPGLHTASCPQMPVRDAGTAMGGQGGLKGCREGEPWGGLEDFHLRAGLLGGWAALRGVELCWRLNGA